MSYSGVGSYYSIPQPGVAPLNGVGSFYTIPQPGVAPLNGMGSYFTFTPHEVFNGMGGLGAFYYLQGFGSTAETFSAAAVWQDVLTTNACYGPEDQRPASPPYGACNAAGSRAVKAVQAALNELGYGPIPVDGNVSSPWEGQWKQFLAQHNLSPGPGFGLTEQGLILMEKFLKEGKTPGPNKPVKFDKVNGEYIPTGDDTAFAGLGAGGLLLAAAVIGGLLVMAGKDKKKDRRGQTRTMMMAK